jgi:hypothetical protein
VGAVEAPLRPLGAGMPAAGARGYSRMKVTVPTGMRAPAAMK